MISKQKWYIIGGLFLIIALLCVYLFVISPWLNAKEEEIPLELEEGEVAYGKNNFLMYEQYKESDIQSIFIHNDTGDYEFYSVSTSEGSGFLIRGKETATFDANKFMTLRSAVTYTLVKKKITGVSDYSQYGFDFGSNSQKYYILTTKSGAKYKVYIGDITPSDANYYCVIEGRDPVYLLDTSVDALVADVKYYITPYLSYPVSSDDYYAVDDFWFTRDGEKIIAIDYLSEQEREANGTTNFYRMTYPTSYNVAYSNFESITKLFMNYQGTEVLEFDHINNKLGNDMLAKYGLDEPKYRVHYTYHGYESEVLISDKNEDGTYYAYSVLFNQICAVDAANVGYLEWDLVKFVNTALFAVNIYDIASIKAETDTINETFLMSGEDSDNFEAKLKSSGKTLNSDYFRQYYMNVLTLYLRDYVEIEDTSSLKCELTLTITTKKGVTTVYRFYPYTTGHCFYTINGVGEFYILRDELDKTVSNTIRLMNGEEVNNSYKE